MTRSRKPINAIYNLHGEVLETVSCAKCLGVGVTSNLSFGSHIDRIVRIANKTLGFVKRNIKTKMPAVRGSLYRYFLAFLGRGPRALWFRDLFILSPVNNSDSYHFKFQFIISPI